MCWIFWYKWPKDAIRILLHGLERLEYRGYDSAWLTVIDKEWKANTRKSVWKVNNLVQEVMKNNTWTASLWIAHTRRATHGWVTTDNCHPHTSNDGKRLLVHNGIIENYLKHKQQLEQQGYTFYSETDSEIIANLLQAHNTWDMLSTVQKVTTLLTWAYALLILNTDFPEQMIGVRLGSPLLLGTSTATNELFFSSDAQALSGYADKMIYLEDGDLLHIDNHDFLVYSSGRPTLRPIEELDQQALQASKGTYKHFMLKEIFEQPNIMRRIYKWRVNFETQQLWADAFHGLQHEEYLEFQRVACGTSYHSSRLGTLWIEEMTGINCRSHIASEYENRTPRVDDRSLHLFVSQSWETADSIACLKQIKERWGKTFGIVNVPGSTIARLTDSGLFTRAGTEIGVASTKAFTAQCLCMLLVSLFLGKRRGMRASQYKHIVTELEQLPMYLESVLGMSEYIRSIAQQLSNVQSIFFLWRGYHVPIAYESSLKLKEISYIHAEAYPAGELKHGPLALIDENTPSVLFMPHDELREKNRGSLHEIKARKGKVLAISDKHVPEADRYIVLPSVCPELMPLVSAVAGQLLAYHIADILWKDIDKPRNLAKSVTVK